MQGAQFRVEVRIAFAASVVILDDVFEGAEAAVVHVGRGVGDLAQRGCLEIAVAGAVVGEAAVALGDPRVVETLVGEIRANVADGTVAFPTKDLEALLLLGR